MTLSIITVNLNNRDGLQRTIDSVISQKFTDYEWIMIDGGSTDGSRELIEQYAKHFSYWCSEPDKGIYNAMNKGIAHAQGEYLQFLNSGDWFAGDEVLSDIFRGQITGDIVYGDYYQTNGKEVIPIQYEQDLSFLTIYYKAIPHTSSFIKREIISNRLYNEELDIVSDWEFFLECALKGLQFTHISIYVTYYDSSGISSSNRNKVLKEREDVIERLVPRSIQKDMELLDKLSNSFADGQLAEIDNIRHKNRFFHRVVTFELWVLRLLDKIFCKSSN